MAALHNQSSNSGHLANVSSASFSHNAGSNDERFIAVLVAPYDPASLSDRTVSSVSYAGQACTNSSADADVGAERTEIWHKFAPTSGSNTVSVTMGGTVDALNVYADSWYNVDQGGLDASNGATQTNESPVTETITTVTANASVLSIIQPVDFGTTGIGADQTQIGTLNSGFSRASYSGPHSTAGSVTHSYTVSGATDACMSLIAINTGSLTTGKRFYLPSSGSAPITSVAFNSGWEDTSIGARLPTYTTKQSTTMTTVSFTDANDTNRDVLFRQYVSEPLAAQSISAQSVVFRMRAKERATSCNLFTTVDIRLVSNDGSVVRGNIVSMRRDGSEASATALTNRNNTGNSTAITCHSGDRLVIEVGMGGDPAAGSDHDSDISIGDDSTTDLGANDTDTSAFNPYVEFANDLIFFETGDIIVHEISSQGAINNSTVTISHTVSSNLSNRGILVGIGANDPTTADLIVNSVTYNGVNLTSLVTQLSTENDERVYWWFLENPATGANNLVVTWAGTVTDGNVHIVTLGNVLQSGQPDDADGTVDDASTTFSVTTTPVTDRSMVFSFCATNDFGSVSPSSPQVQLASTNSGFWVTSYTNPTSPAGSVTHNYTNGNTDDSTLVAVAIKKFTSATTAIKDIIMGGVVPFVR